MKNNKNCLGFSLVELMIAIAIGGFIIGGAILAMQGLGKGMVSTTNKLTVERKIRNVTEQIKNEAKGQFQTMDETSRDRTCPPDYSPALPSTHHLCTDDDRKVQIFSTISPADPIKRTREVMLLAKWMEDGTQTEKKSTFQISQVRGQATGGKILVTVTSVINGNPIPGMDATIAGENNPQVSCRTGLDGTCVINGVRFGTNTLTMDGWIANNYFSLSASPNCNVAPASYSKEESVHVANSRDVVQINTQACPPAIAEGTVRDFAGINSPLENIQVGILAKTNGMVIPSGNSSDRAKKAWTDSNGKYVIKAPAGTYSVYVMGNSSYSAVGRINDLSEVHPNREYIQLYSGQSTYADLKTIKKGNIRMRMRGVNYLDGTYDHPMLVDPTRTYLTFKADHNYVRPGYPSGYMSSSALWSKTHFPEILDYYVTTKHFYFTNGDWQDVPSFGPMILDRSYDLSASHLVSEYSHYSDQWAPFTPIMVFADPNSTIDLKNPKLQIADWGMGAYGVSNTLFAPTDMSHDWAYDKIYPNQDIDIEKYYLLEGSFGNISGNLVKTDLTPFIIPNSTFNTHLKTVWSKDGYGMLERYLWNGIYRTKIDGRKVVSPPVSAMGGSAYNLGSWAGYNVLPPNVGTDKTVLHFNTYSSVTQSTSSVLKMNLYTYRKVCTGSTVTDQKVTDFSSEPSVDLKVTSDMSGIAQSILTSNLTMSFNPGGDTGQDKPVGPISSRMGISYSGKSDPISVIPGQTVSNVDIVIDEDVSYDTLIVKYNGDSHWAGVAAGTYYFTRSGMNGSNNEFTNSAATFRLYLAGTSGTISGRVVNRYDQPVSGASVKFTTTYYTDVNATTDNNGYFSFSNLPFVQYYGLNPYNLTITAGSNAPISLATNACDGMDWNAGEVKLSCDICTSGTGGL